MFSVSLPTVAVNGTSIPCLKPSLGSTRFIVPNGVSAGTKYRRRMRGLKGVRESSNSPHQICCKAQLADLAPATSAVYGALLLGGGIFAYTRSGSKGSLLGGVSGAALMAITYFLMQAPETRGIGDALGFGSAFLFSSIFGIRLAATRKLTPAGPLLGLSFCALVVFISAYMQDRI